MCTLDRTNFIKYKEKYNLETFIETGYGKGYGVKIAHQAKFKNIYSCDIVVNKIENVARDHPNAIILGINSFDFLRTILPNIKSKTLFWLDAHFPSNHDNTKEYENKYNFPLLKELQLIVEFKYNFKDDVIICDDVAAIKGHIDIEMNNKNTMVPEKFQCTEYDMKPIFEVLKDSHTLEYSIHGYMTFLPK